jgi:hypothetical protein
MHGPQPTHRRAVLRSPRAYTTSRTSRAASFLVFARANIEHAWPCELSCRMFRTFPSITPEAAAPLGTGRVPALLHMMSMLAPITSEPTCTLCGKFTGSSTSAACALLDLIWCPQGSSLADVSGCGFPVTEANGDPKDHSRADKKPFSVHVAVAQASCICMAATARSGSRWH